MLSNTLINALNTYKIYIQCGNGMRTKAEIDRILKRIQSCEVYINEGNEVSTSWLHSNYEVLSKAVKHAHDLFHRNDEMNEEHRDLNRLMKIYIDFFEENNIDVVYMSI